MFCTYFTNNLTVEYNRINALFVWVSLEIKKIYIIQETIYHAVLLHMRTTI